MLDSLKTLLQDQVRDLYSAESQIVKALPKMAKAATSQSLRHAFSSHLEQSRGHVDRIQEIAGILESKPGGKKCKAAEGLIAEAGEVLDASGDDAVIDAALIAAAQRVEHYEISAYRSAIAMAEHLGEERVVRLLQQTLDEETAADETLSGISAGEVLPAADSAHRAPSGANGAKARRR